MDEILGNHRMGGIRFAVVITFAFLTQGYYGMNDNTPMTAAAKTSNAGLILYRSRISRVATARAPVSTPVIAPFAMVKQPASNKPIETGARPS